MYWKKLGHIFCANGNSSWLHSHAMIPIAEQIDGSIFRIYFSSRDIQNRGHGAFVEIDLRDHTKILRISSNPVLVPGSLGCFDDSGALPNSIVRVGRRKLLYYTGINLGVTVKIRNSIGLAEWNEDTQCFERCYSGPIIDRTKEFPHFVATPEVMYENGIYRAWFTSCTEWRIEGGVPKHFYRLEYAESLDGINWLREGKIAIDYQDRLEYAMGVPRVVKDGGLYKMWFCARGTVAAPSYRIYYADSIDGVVWNRKTDSEVLSVSSHGWDSEMVCYPYIFDYRGERYMLYNGNDYGRTGFGLAVWSN